jgi:glycosyltransferase involved in cell wall biosynthesis
MRKACFFARVNTPSVLDRFEFYAQDIQILRDLGFNVRVATRPVELRPADLYFVWWWTWAFFPVSMARLLRRPIVITGTFDVGNFNTKPAWQQRLVLHALKNADANVFVSQMEYKQVPEQFPVRCPCYSPHIVDTRKYTPNGDRSQDVVLSVGWLEGENAVRKGMPELIQAAPIIHRKHPEVRFIIAGEKGSGYPALRRMVRDVEADNYIEFPGAISTAKKIELMQTCKVYLQPSRFEGFGLAILEAMSCGAPVVTSPVGAIPEVVGDTAIQVDGRSPEAIAAGVNRFLDDPALRRQFGEHARKRAETVFPYARREQDLKRVIADLFPSSLEDKSREFACGGDRRTTSEENR